MTHKRVELFFVYKRIELFFVYKFAFCVHDIIILLLALNQQLNQRWHNTSNYFARDWKRSWERSILHENVLLSSSFKNEIEIFLEEDEFMAIFISYINVIWFHFVSQSEDHLRHLTWIPKNGEQQQQAEEEILGIMTSEILSVSYPVIFLCKMVFGILQSFHTLRQSQQQPSQEKELFSKLALHIKEQRTEGTIDRHIDIAFEWRRDHTLHGLCQIHPRRVVVKNYMASEGKDYSREESHEDMKSQSQEGHNRRSQKGNQFHGSV